MLYRSYKEKLNSRLNVIEAMMKFRLLILIGIILIICFVTVMLIMDGRFYKETCSGSAVYGEVVVPQSNAFFTDKITYEFRADDKDVWTDEKPKCVGKYEVRAVSRGAFGVKIYGKIFHFEITPKPAQIEIYEKEIVYGEMPKFGAVLEYGDEITIENYNYIIKEDAIKLFVTDDDIIVLDENGNDVTSCYDFNFDFSELTVFKRPISLEILSAEKVYDGQPLTSNKYSLKGELAKGEDLRISFTESMVDVGEKANLPQFAVINEKKGDVTDFYDIDLKVGSLKVKARPIKILTSSQTLLYDGNEHGSADFDMVFDDDYYDLLEGHKINVVSYPTFVNAGSYVNKTEIAITDAKNNDVTKYYDIDFEYGTFEIERRHLKVTSESMTWDYDDKEHSYPYYNCESDNLLNGHSISLSSYPTVINAGRFENGTEIKVTNNKGEDVTQNYEVECDFGILEILPRKITVVSGSGFWVYDGEEHFCQDAAINEGELIYGHNITYSYKKFTDVGEYTNTVNAKITDPYIKDITGNYEINYIFGTLTINKRKILLKSGSKTWVYDGKEHSFPKVEVIHKDGYYDLVESHTMFASESKAVTQITDTETDVRYEQNVIKSEWVRIFDIYTANEVTDNYDIEFDYYGNLRIKTPTILMLSSKKKIYDGLPLDFNVNTDCKIIKQPPNERTVINQNYPLSIYEVDNITLNSTINAISVEVYDMLNGNAPVSDEETQIEYVGEEKTLEIFKRAIEISSVSSARANGITQFEDKRAYLSMGTLADGHSMQVTVTGVIYYNQKGPVENTIESVIIFDEDGNDVTNNYEITLHHGTLSWITDWGQ